MVREAFDASFERRRRGFLLQSSQQSSHSRLKGAIQAHHYLHERRNIGKVVLVRHGVSEKEVSQQVPWG